MPSAKKRKSTKSSGARKGGAGANAGEAKRAKSAYTYFCTDCRADVLRKNGISGGGDSFGQATQLLAAIWKDTPQAERQKYEACADVDRHRVALGKLRKEARSDGAAGRLAAGVKDALNALSRAPALARTLGACGEAVEVLESLDKRMSISVRAAVGVALASVCTAPATAASIQRSLGRMLGDRVAAFLRRLAAAPSKCKETSPTSVATKAAALKASQADAAPKDPILLPADASDSTRRKVVGLLMRSFAKGGGKAEIGKAKEIEQALYEAVAADAREYKGRARAILSNLSASDGSLIRRVLAAEVTPFDLVRLSADDLVSETKQAERREQREKVLKESLLTAQPKKRHRGLMTDDGNYNCRQEQYSASEDEEEAADAPEEEEEEGGPDSGPKLDPLVAAARAAAAQSMLELNDADGKDTDSSSSSGSDSESDSSDGCGDLLFPLATAVKSLPTPVRAAAKAALKTAGVPSSKAASSTTPAVASKTFTAAQKAAAAAKLAKIAKADAQRKVDALSKAAAGEESSSSSSSSESDL